MECPLESCSCKVPVKIRMLICDLGRTYTGKPTHFLGLGQGYNLRYLKCKCMQAAVALRAPFRRAFWPYPSPASWVTWRAGSENSNDYINVSFLGIGMKSLLLEQGSRGSSLKSGSSYTFPG